MPASNRLPPTWSVLLLAGLWLAAAGTARAQSCAVPVHLTPNVPTWIDTCSGDAYLPFVCAAIGLTGPAGIVRMPLPYPTGRIIVESYTGLHNPALFLLHAQCNANAPCGHAVDSGHTIDTLELSVVDSGDYLLAIAPYDPNSIPCGHVIVTHDLTPQEQALAMEGVLRSGSEAAMAIP